MDVTEEIQEESGSGEGGNQSRTRNFPPYNTGDVWTGTGGGGYDHVMPIQPPMPPFPGGYDYGHPPSVAAGGALYPPIGFNPAILYPAVNPTSMECPICKKILSPPIYQCKNGHVICNGCMDRLDYCISEAECLSSLEGPRIRNYALELIYQSHQFKCPYEGEGCMSMLSGEHLTNHVEVCEFRALPFCSTSFGWLNCPEKCTRSTLVSHLREHHQVKETQLDKFSLKLIAPTRSLSVATLSSSPSSEAILWEPLLITSPVSDNEHILVKCFVSPRGYVSLAGQFFTTTAPPADSDWKKYGIKFQIKSASKVACLEWTGRLMFHYINESSTVNDSCEANNLNTFRVSLESLEGYIKSTVDSELSTMKINVCVWKHLDNNEERHPFKECFINSETGEEYPLDKLTLFGKHPTESSNELSFMQVDSSYFRRTMMPVTAAVSYAEEEYANYFPLDSNCRHCSRPLYGNVIYQCLQCPSEHAATYFCRQCVEWENNHREHLMVRISKPALQPFAAVAFQCCAGELH